MMLRNAVDFYKMNPEAGASIFGKNFLKQIEKPIKAKVPGKKGRYQTSPYARGASEVQTHIPKGPARGQQLGSGQTRELALQQAATEQFGKGPAASWPTCSAHTPSRSVSSAYKRSNKR